MPDTELPYIHRHSVSRTNISNEFGTTMKLVLFIYMYINEIYSTVQIDNNWYDIFPLPNGLKKDDDLPPILFNLVLEYTVWNDQGNKDVVGTEWDISASGLCCS